MLSLYEILKASKTGIAPDMWTALTGKNWGGADSGHEVKELTGIPPLSFTADGTSLLDYLISGNMSQSGTPTPDNPIQPSECGELETTGEHAGQYKIPISSADTTTNIYLGEVPTTRRIRKLVLTGDEENWYYYENATGTVKFFYFVIVRVNGINLTRLPNTHGFNTTEVTQQSGNTLIRIYAVSEGMETIEEWKSYLAAQYANGTPFCVWYVLATEETGIVNEPIRKIGDYADTVSMEQAGVQIPTNRGNTVIDVMTELKPSEMYIKYQK